MYAMRAWFIDAAVTATSNIQRRTEDLVEMMQLKGTASLARPSFRFLHPHTFCWVLRGKAAIRTPIEKFSDHLQILYVDGLWREGCELLLPCLCYNGGQIETAEALREVGGEFH